MKLLVTGANGMVGKNLCENEEILANYEILNPRSSELNLLNYNDVLKYLQKNKPDYIVHCAGRVGGIQANISQPTSFLYENLEMGKNIVMAAKESSIKNLLNLGSSCMYPRNYKNPLKEEYILQAELEPTNEGYALAKIATAKLCEYINREDSSFNYKTLIPSNLYGKHDKFDPKVSHMIPAVIRKIHEAKESNSNVVEIWGDGKARREFMLASDLADFIAFSLKNIDKIDQYTNVGLGYDYSINEYYQTIAKIIGYDGDFKHDLSKPSGMKQKVIDPEKMEKLGWKAKHSLEEGIEITYNYFLKEVL